MNRIDRLTAILTQLQAKRLVKASEIAKRFNISLRTVYRDMRALEETGVPILGEAGMGYSLVEGYRLPPIMFTKEEALAFLMAEKIVEKITDKHNSQQIQSAMFKIKAVLRTAEKEVLDDVAENIEIVKKRNSLVAKGQSNALQTILGSVSDRKVLSILYTTFVEEQTTERLIEPVGIYYAYEQWYLIAYCRLRKAYRTFRVDRIASLKVSTEKFKNKHPSLKTYLDTIEEKEQVVKVVLHIDKAKAKYVGEHRYAMGFVMEIDRGKVMEMVFMTTSLEGFLRWIIMLADSVTIIQPLELKQNLKKVLHNMLNRLESY